MSRDHILLFEVKFSKFSLSKTALINKFEYCHSMPRAGARSEKAKAQRASRKRGFDSDSVDSAFTDDPFEKLLATDYEPSEASDNEESDTEDEEHDINYSFSMADTPESDLSIKKASENQEEDQDDEGEYRDYEAEEAASASERLQTLVQSVSGSEFDCKEHDLMYFQKKPRLLSALPTYS